MPPITTTSDALLAVERTARGHAVRGLHRGARLAPRVLELGATVRAALVPTQAGPLAGDHDRVRLHVGADATLVLEPIAATLALPGSARTTIELEAEVEPGGRLVLDEPPLILAAGADVVRTIRLALGPGAIAVVRDVVVLGRAGEGAGRLDSVLRATIEGDVLLHDALRIDPAMGTEHLHVALAPGHRVIGTVCVLGASPAADGQATDSAELFPLSGPGLLRRATGTSLAPVDAALATPWAHWIRDVMSTSV